MLKIIIKPPGINLKFENAVAPKRASRASVTTSAIHQPALYEPRIIKYPAKMSIKPEAPPATFGNTLII